MVPGAFRGWVRIVRGGARSRASQLIRGVRRTNGGTWRTTVAAKTRPTTESQAARRISTAEAAEAATETVANGEPRPALPSHEGSEPARHGEARPC